MIEVCVGWDLGPLLWARPPACGVCVLCCVVVKHVKLIRVPTRIARSRFPTVRCYLGLWAYLKRA